MLIPELSVNAPPNPIIDWYLIEEFMTTPDRMGIFIYFT